VGFYFAPFGVKTMNKVLLVIGLFLGFASSVFAVGPDFSSLTGAVDFSTVGTAILAICALLAVPLVIRKGAKMVLAAIK
jgi:hypothetical protein